MRSKEVVTPSKAAFRLTHLLDAAFGAATRFPVDVKTLAKDVADALHLDERITAVKPANLDSFEGGLFQVEPQSWALLYNEELLSPGRILFTQAHELGHFLVHRQQQTSFECSQAEVGGFDLSHRKMEAEADEFASTLLMPLNQFRASVAGQAVDLEVLSGAARKFGVSLTAASLRWLRSTDESAILVLSRDGFIDWSISSDRAFHNGAFIRTQGRTVALPTGSLAEASDTQTSRAGARVPLRTWFEHAHPDAEMREMKLRCDNYGYTLSLLHLSPTDLVWAPRSWD